MAVNGAVIVCEDLRFEVGGKLVITGMYTGDIAIDPALGAVTRLMFIFLIEHNHDDLPAPVSIEVTLPNGHTGREELIFRDQMASDRRLIHRGVVVFYNQDLTVGAIVAKVKWAGGEESFFAPRVVLAASALARNNATDDPSASPPPSSRSPTARQA